MGGKYDANSFTSKPLSGKYFYKKLSIPSFHTAWTRSGLYIVFEIPEACILMPVALTPMLSATFVETLVDIQTVQIINTIWLG